LVADALPAEVLPGSLNFTLNLFEAEFTVENRTAETLYLTALTTTTGQPLVIAQNTFARQRDIPLAPGETHSLIYDAADFPLAGVLVCLETGECRISPQNGTESRLVVADFDALTPADSAWVAVAKSHPAYDWTGWLVLLFSVIPLAFWAAWWRMRQAKPA
jgi:hypothetical protein